TVFFTYDGISGSVYGGIIDASAPSTITSLNFPAGMPSTGIIPGLAIAGSKLYSAYASYVFATNKTTGAGLYYTDIAGLSVFPTFRKPLHYIPSTGEFIVFGTNTIYRVTDGGSSFSQVGSTITTATNPATFGNAATWSGFSSGNIIVNGNNTTPFGIYSGPSNVWYPTAVCPTDYIFGFQMFAGERQISEITINSKKWFMDPAPVEINRVAFNTGRLRYGIYAYNTGTHQ